MKTPLPGNAEPQLGKTEGRQRGRGDLPSGVLQPGPSKGWYSRGYLPHRDHPGLIQAITYRLADSLPADALARMEEELRLAHPRRLEANRRKRLEGWLDAGHGCCALRNPRAADCVVDTWRRFVGERYDLIAWVVMPNHVHVLVRVYEGIALARIVQSWKSYTGRRIAQLMSEEERCRAGAGQPGNADAHVGHCRAGARRSRMVWMREYWDRFIRNEKHFAATVNYIHENPVKAGLVSHPEDWPWSSAKEYQEAELGLGDPK